MFHLKEAISYPENSKFILTRCVGSSSLFLVLVSLLFGCGGPEYPKCENDDDCHSGEYCVNGMCQMCRDTSDCPSGHSCINGRCEPIENYCQSSTDCGVGEECRNNRCEAVEQTLAPAQTRKVPKDCVLHSIYFDYDSSTIRTDGRNELTEDAKCIRKKSFGKLDVTGYCDPRGTEEYNLALGERRANSAKEYLMALGISGDRIKTISYGELRPADPASNPVAWALNRRDTFTLFQ